MKTVTSVDTLRDALAPFRHSGKRIGFVPTMGALHDGHLSLIRLAHKHTNAVVASIFVNPTQFAPHEDFDTYPRDTETDSALLEEEGVDILFLPTKNVLYPDGLDLDLDLGDAAKGLETDFRPHFFGGVVNVVSRLFKAVEPDVAIFGEKDFQQLQVIREMVSDYNLETEIIGAPIARDEHGLALSSRNEYLNTDDLEIARQLNVILRDIADGSDINAGKEQLLEIGFSKIDYIEKRWGRALVAAWLGKTRLIDNIALSS